MTIISCFFIDHEGEQRRPGSSEGYGQHLIISISFWFSGGVYLFVASATSSGAQGCLQLIGARAKSGFIESPWLPTELVLDEQGISDW